MHTVSISLHCPFFTEQNDDYDPIAEQKKSHSKHLGIVLNFINRTGCFQDSSSLAKMFGYVRKLLPNKFKWENLAKEIITHDYDKIQIFC